MSRYIHILAKAYSINIDILLEVYENFLISIFELFSKTTGRGTRVPAMLPGIPAGWRADG
jgi:hypothetical protein